MSSMESRQDDSGSSGGGGYEMFGGGGDQRDGVSVTSRVSMNSYAVDGRVLSNATYVATGAARSVLSSGGSEEAALKTAKAAAQSILMGDLTSHQSSKNPMRRRKAKQQAEVVASMALVSAANNRQHAQWDVMTTMSRQASSIAPTPAANSSVFGSSYQAREPRQMDLSRVPDQSPSTLYRTMDGTGDVSSLMGHPKEPPASVGYTETHLPRSSPGNVNSLLEYPPAVLRYTMDDPNVPRFSPGKVTAATPRASPLRAPARSSLLESDDVMVKPVAIHVGAAEEQAREQPAVTAPAASSPKRNSNTVLSKIEDPIYYLDNTTASATTNGDDTFNDDDHHEGRRFRGISLTSTSMSDIYSSQYTGSTSTLDDTLATRGTTEGNQLMAPLLFSFANAFSCGPSPPVEDIVLKDAVTTNKLNCVNAALANESRTEQRQAVKNEIRAPPPSVGYSSTNSTSSYDSPLPTKITILGQPYQKLASPRRQQSNHWSDFEQDFELSYKPGNKRVVAFKRTLGSIKSKSVKLTQKSVSLTKEKSAILRKKLAKSPSISAAE